jgi:hypothetical protein
LEDLTVFLSRVNQFVVREELAVVQLFGADRGTKLLCEMLQSVFKPFHAAISQNIFSVTDVFDSYCAVEGFVLRTLPLLVRAGQQAANETNKSIFSSLVTFLPTYVDIENGEAHRLMLDLVNSVTFGCDADSLDGGGLDNGLFGSERDLGEQLNSYSDGLVCAVDSVHICFEASLRRAVCFMGGVRSKAVITGLFTNLADFAKQMAIRIEDLAVASGAASVDLKLEDNNEEDKSSNSSKALSLGQQLDSCDIDNRLLIACSLRALQTVGRFLLRVDQVKHLTIQSLLELNGAIFPNGQNTVTFGQVLDNSISCAAFTVLQDPLEISELWSFLVLVGNSQRHTTLDMFSSILAPSLRRMQLSACDLLFNLSITLPDKLFSNIVADECWSDSANSTESILPQSVVTQVRCSNVSCLHFSLFKGWRAPTLSSARTGGLRVQRCVGGSFVCAGTDRWTCGEVTRMEPDGGNFANIRCNFYIFVCNNYLLCHSTFAEHCFGTSMSENEFWKSFGHFGENFIRHKQ